MPRGASNKLTIEQRRATIAWLTANLLTAPDDVRSGLQEILGHLTAGQVSLKNFNALCRQLALALGLIPSSERRRSGNPLGPAGAAGGSAMPKNDRERLEQQIEQGNARAQRYDDLRNKQLAKTERLVEKLEAMPDSEEKWPGLTVDTPLDEIELTEEEQQRAADETASLTAHLGLGDGRDPTLQAPPEKLMNGSVVNVAEESVYLDVELPEGVTEQNVVKTLTQKRQRFDFTVSVTRLDLEVEKKVVVKDDGSRQIISASTSEFGPPRFAVTWQALATLAVMVGQFAMPLNRLATMLSTPLKRFTAAGLSRMARYIATRLLPIYLELSDQVADSAIFGGDDTSCRVIEVSSYFSQQRNKAQREPPPWATYRTVKDAEKTHDMVSLMKKVLLARRQAGDREAKRTPVMEPSLCVQVGKELGFESRRRNGDGPKQSLNTTVLTGRSDADDPRSEIIFYRSHLGSLGNLIEMLLRKRRRAARKLTVQSDLSTANLVTDPELTSRFDIDMAGCSSHARRPFAQYEDHDPVWAPYMLQLFKGLALHEDCLNRYGRNRENVLAVRNTDSRKLWESIKAVATKMAQAWTKATPLGAGARYILKHYEKLTAYLRNPRLDASNNLRERLLRPEKLIEKSAMFRRTIEGRVVLDILRTILQTAVAAGVPAHEYLVDVMRASPDDVAASPENYTPLAWAKRKQAAQQSP